MWIWALIKNNLDVIVPVLVPVGFNVVNFGLKWERKVLNPNLLGADMSAGSSSLYAGTVLGAIYYNRLTGTNDIVTAVVIAGLLLLNWWICLSLGSKTFPIAKGTAAQPLIGFIFGCLGLYYGCVFAWHILRGAL